MLHLHLLIRQKRKDGICGVYDFRSYNPNTLNIFGYGPIAEVPQILYFFYKGTDIDKSTCCIICDMRSNANHAVIIFHYAIKSDVVSTIGIGPCEVNMSWIKVLSKLYRCVIVLVQNFKCKAIQHLVNLSMVKCRSGCFTWLSPINMWFEMKQMCCP